MKGPFLVWAFPDEIAYRTAAIGLRQRDPLGERWAMGWGTWQGKVDPHVLAVSLDLIKANPSFLAVPQGEQAVLLVTANGDSFVIGRDLSPEHVGQWYKVSEALARAREGYTVLTWPAASAGHYIAI